MERAIWILFIYISVISLYHAWLIQDLQKFVKRFESEDTEKLECNKCGGKVIQVGESTFKCENCNNIESEE